MTHSLSNLDCTSDIIYSVDLHDERTVRDVCAAASLLRLQSSIRRVAAEFEQLARQDVRLPLVERDSCTVILAMSSWEFSEFSHLRRAPKGRKEKPRTRTIRAS